MTEKDLHLLERHHTLLASLYNCLEYLTYLAHTSYVGLVPSLSVFLSLSHLSFFPTVGPSVARATSSQALCRVASFCVQT